MAVLLNIISSGSRKSAGAATFRRVRGRTIMSQKRGASTKAAETRAAAGLVRTYREAMFFIVTAFADGMQNSINESFEPTKYGSRRNAFFKLNYSAIELAVNGCDLGLALLDQLMHNVSFTGVSVPDGEASSVSFTAFSADGFSTLLNRAADAGVVGSYIRSTIGLTLYEPFDEPWSQNEDPGNANITSFSVITGVSQTNGQAIINVGMSGTNLPAAPNYSIRVGSTSATPLDGEWVRTKFTTSAAQQAVLYAGTYTVYIMEGSRVLAQRDVTFYASGAGGE